MKGQKTGGRVKGTPNKATADVKAAAQKHGPAALKKLVHLMQNGASEQTQIAASKEILDRAYGKATQPLSGAEDELPIQIAVIERRIVKADN